LLAAAGGASLPGDDASELAVAALGIIFATLMLDNAELAASGI
jgi:hypothetical protein